MKRRAPRAPKGKRQNRSVGFGLVELVSIMVVSVMFSGLVIYFMFEYWRSTATLSNNLATYVSRLTAGDRLRDAINASSGFITQNSISDAHAGDPDPVIASGDYWRPVHAIPSNILMGASGSIAPVLYFRSPSVDSSKNIVMNGTQPYEDEYMLYLDGSTKQMRMRVLANTNATDNRATTTCPSASVSGACPIDKLIGENIASVGTRYFSRSGNLMDYTSIVDPDTGAYIGPDMPAVEVVEFILYTYKKSTLQGGADTTSQTIIRIALRNT